MQKVKAQRPRLVDKPPVLQFGAAEVEQEADTQARRVETICDLPRSAVSDRLSAMVFSLELRILIGALGAPPRHCSTSFSIVSRQNGEKSSQRAPKRRNRTIRPSGDSLNGEALPQQLATPTTLQSNAGPQYSAPHWRGRRRSHTCTWFEHLSWPVRSHQSSLAGHLQGRRPLHPNYQPTLHRSA